MAGTYVGRVLFCLCFSTCRRIEQVTPAWIPPEVQATVIVAIPQLTIWYGVVMYLHGDPISWSHIYTLWRTFCTFNTTLFAASRGGLSGAMRSGRKGLPYMSEWFLLGTAWATLGTVGAAVFATRPFFEFWGYVLFCACAGWLACDSFMASLPVSSGSTVEVVDSVRLLHGVAAG